MQHAGNLAATDGEKARKGYLQRSGAEQITKNRTQAIVSAAYSYFAKKENHRGCLQQRATSRKGTLIFVLCSESAFGNFGGFVRFIGEVCGRCVA